LEAGRKIYDKLSFRLQAVFEGLVRWAFCFVEQEKDLSRYFSAMLTDLNAEIPPIRSGRRISDSTLKIYIRELKKEGLIEVKFSKQKVTWKFTEKGLRLIEYYVYTVLRLSASFLF